MQKTFDGDTILEPDEDSYETTNDHVTHLEKTYKVKFVFDAAAQDYNKKCRKFTNDALHAEWMIEELKEKDAAVWCNPPHSLSQEFIKRAEMQYRKYNINIVMIVPTNCESSKTWHKYIENETEQFRENHPLYQRPKFLKRGRKTKHGSRNAYRVIVWRKK